MLVQAFVVVGDSNGHVGLGVKCAKEVSRSRHSLKHSEAPLVLSWEHCVIVWGELRRHRSWCSAPLSARTDCYWMGAKRSWYTAVQARVVRGGHQ